MTSNKSRTINLKDYIEPRDSTSLSGRPLGLKVRENIKLDYLEENYDTINIVIPKTITVINPSYFLGLFGSSVRKLKYEGFKDKYVFDLDLLDDENRINIQADIEDGIDRALKERGIL